MRLVKALTIIAGTGVVIGVTVVAFLLGNIFGAQQGEPYEILCPTPVVVYCDCNVSVDCCCPTEEATPSPSAEASATSSPTDAPRATGTPPLATTVVPTRECCTPTQTPEVTDAPPSPSPTVRTSTPEPTCTTMVLLTVTPTDVVISPTNTVEPTPTEECECVWICWNFNKCQGYWKNYCCPLGDNHCVESHLKKGDSYLGRCQHGEETHPDDGYCLP